MTTTTSINKALITGASSGIGLATAQTLLAQNIAVTGIARDFSNTQCEQLNKVELDLSKVDQLPNQLKQQSELQDDFDVLILNAGYGRFGSLEQFSFDQIQHLLNTNLTSNLFLLKHYLPKLKRQGNKDIVLIGSESSLNGAKAGSVYCASKFAIRGLAQSLRAECASNGIRVILVNPGAVRTDFFDDTYFEPAQGEQFALTAQDIANTIVQSLQMPRHCVLEEINIQPIKRVFNKK